MSEAKHRTAAQVVACLHSFVEPSAESLYANEKELLQEDIEFLDNTWISGLLSRREVMTAYLESVTLPQKASK